MKWKNRGHEFDQVFRNMEEKRAFYLFGAGDYGRLFLKAFRNQIEIVGFIDNDVRKQGTKIFDIPCVGLSEISRNDSIGIIVTMSQIARTHPLEQLIENGFIKDKDFFLIEEFISIWNVYKYNRVYFSTISFLPSTACNLNCKYCLNFNPFAEQYYVREWDELIKDVDLFFACVDHIMLFHVSGGEPMLYVHLMNLIEYIDKNYGDRIDTLRTVTNGTIVPSDDMCRRLAQCRVEVTVDDYRDAVPHYSDQFQKLISKFDEFKVKYYVNKFDNWIDLAPERTDYSKLSDEELIRHRSECSQSWQELRNGKLYNCNYAAYATVAGIAGEQDTEEVYDLYNFSPEKKKELVEFRLGYTTKGYTNFCKTCRGFKKENPINVPAAEQWIQKEKRYIDK